jgi:hypothetical protein
MQLTRAFRNRTLMALMANLTALIAHGLGAALAASNVTTLAGTGTQGPVINGPGNIAQFQWVLDVALDAAGNVYVPDYGNEVIRKITPAGFVSTYAGVAQTSGWVDGQAATAQFALPRHIAIDGSNNAYTFDYLTQRIRKISSTGVVSTLAGSGAQGYVNAG